MSFDIGRIDTGSWAEGGLAAFCFLEGRMKVLFLILILFSSVGASEISHGPMLGAVSEESAHIWVRTAEAASVVFTVREQDGQMEVANQTLKTEAHSDFTCIAKIEGLKKDTAYSYDVAVGDQRFEASFTTLGPSLKKRPLRLVFGYGYKPGDKMKDPESIFLKMKERKGDFVLFLGDFPYTKAGRRTEVWQENKVIRDNIGFTPLTSGTSTYAIWDDHDFGPNDCDGTHEYAEEALHGFLDYWPNGSYGLPNTKGIFRSFVIGDVEVFLLDGRYHARQSKENPTMLGQVQLQWLREGLKNSQARYKLLVSGTPFARVKRDCWGGSFYRAERDALFRYIVEEDIQGVLGISGDIHRCDIHKMPLGKGRFFYDFTGGSLARTHRQPPDPWDDRLLYSYGKPEKNMFAEIDFYPADSTGAAVVLRSFSGASGLTHQLKLTPQDLGIKTHTDD